MEEYTTLASEMYSELKRSHRRRGRIIAFLTALVCILTAMVMGMSATRAGAANHTAATAQLQRVNLKTEFTEPECERFRQLCNFTDEERQVFDLRVKGRTIIEIQLALNMSEATVNRRLKAVKRKIFKVL